MAALITIADLNVFKVAFMFLINISRPAELAELCPPFDEH
jgi:hypothetical protein